MAWTYVFDRNNDSKIDYLALFLGPLPIKQKEFPSNYPKGGIIGQLKNYGKFTAEDIEIFKKSWRPVFRHIVDENFDGTADAVVVEVMDSERFWVDRWMALRSSNFNGVVDVCWQFQDSIQVKVRNCLKLAGGYWSCRAGVKKSVFGNEELTKESEVLSIINQAASLCGLTKDSFYKE